MERKKARIDDRVNDIIKRNGTNYSQLSPSNQWVSIITSPSRVNQSHQLRPVMMGQTTQIMLDQNGTLIGSPITSPGFNPSCMMSPFRMRDILPPQYPKPVQYNMDHKWHHVDFLDKVFSIIS